MYIIQIIQLSSCTSATHITTLLSSAQFTDLRASLACFTLARVSLARSSLVRFTMTRSQLGAFQFGAMSVWRVPLWRVFNFCSYVGPVCTFLSAKECCLCQFGAYYFGAYLYGAFSVLHSIVCVISILILSTCHRGYTLAISLSKKEPQKVHMQQFSAHVNEIHIDIDS